MKMGRDIPVVPNAVVNSSGAPRFGTYRGELPMIALRRLSGEFEPPWWKEKIRRKRWKYTMAVTDEVLMGQAVVDGQYFSNAFYYVVDLFKEEMIAKGSFVGIPSLQGDVNDYPGRGHEARFRCPGVELRIERGADGGAYQWRSKLSPLRLMQPGGLQMEAQMEPRGGAPALTAIAPVGEGGVVNITQKWAGLPLSGHLRVGTRTYRLDGGLGGLDYSQGILARRTAWKWAMALGYLSDGRRVGINIVAGFNDDHPTANENGLWIDDRLIPLGRARFEFNVDDPSQSWTVYTEDKNLELYFQPYYVHREDKNLGVITSHFIQPAGRFEGRLKLDGKVHHLFLAGVTEDQDVRW